LKAAQINANAETKTKPNPKAEPSTSTKTNPDTDADTDDESCISPNSGDYMSADTDQTIGDSPTTKPKEIGQPSPSPGNRLEHIKKSWRNRNSTIGRQQR